MPTTPPDDPFSLLAEEDALITPAPAAHPTLKPPAPDEPVQDTAPQSLRRPYEPKSLSIRHDLIMNWLIANPHLSQRECAAFFGVSETWLSIIIHSHAFQARLAEKQRELFSATVASIRDKLESVAHISLDRLAEVISESDDPEYILDAADRALHRLGYAPRTGSSAQPNNVTQYNTQINVVDRQSLQEARALMDAARSLQHPPAALTSDNEDPAP